MTCKIEIGILGDFIIGQLDADLIQFSGHRRFFIQVLQKIGQAARIAVPVTTTTVLYSCNIERLSIDQSYKVED